MQSVMQRLYMGYIATTGCGPKHGTHWNVHLHQRHADVMRNPLCNATADGI